MKGRRFVALVVCVAGLIGLVGCASPAPVKPDGDGAGTAAELLPSFAEGIAFIRGGESFVVRNGKTQVLSENGAKKLDIGYSADRRSLFVTEDHGVRRVVRVIPVGGETSASVALDSGDGGNLGSVHAPAVSGPLYYTVFGNPDNHLVVSETASSKTATLALETAFSGEFDVDSSGTFIVYTGSRQNPAEVRLRNTAEEKALAAGFATAFTPAFSPDGLEVCFTGSRRAGGPMSIWVVRRDSGESRQVAGTENMWPTCPVFSPDGQYIAFRVADGGGIWVVPADGGSPRRLPLICDEAPIAW